MNTQYIQRTTATMNLSELEELESQKFMYICNTKPKHWKFLTM